MFEFRLRPHMTWEIGVDQNVPRVSPGGEKIIFAMGDEAGDATWDDVDHLTEFRLYLPTYHNDHELTFY